MKLAGFINRTTFLKYTKARHIVPKRGRRNLKFYSRAKMLELARDRAAAEERRHAPVKRDPLGDPLARGAMHARVFALFREKVPLYEVVERLQIEAEIVEQLFKQWWKLGAMTQAWLESPTSTATTVAEKPVVGPTPAEALAFPQVAPMPPPTPHAAPSSVGAPPGHKPAADGSCCPKHLLEITSRITKGFDATLDKLTEARKSKP
jgi:hypothetical protein